MPRVALVITTHERPDALAAVLDSVARQRDAPDIVVIADDGSGAGTREIIAGFRRRALVPVRDVRQEHEGFRVARLRNLAIAAVAPADPDYLVFVDGDMLLHPEFIADHRRFARPGWFTQGVRVLADAALTRRLLADPSQPLTPASTGLGGLRRAYLLHSPAAAAAARVLANGLVAIKSCNFAAWRDDLVGVNGFDEGFSGWGPEDKELALRLRHAGVRRQTLLFGGIAVHLHHPAASRERLAANLARLETTRRERRTRATHGLDSHRDA
ncbi:MAG TPA: glycosyltransferase family 2 protein [Steroidobacteraceae bacterium]|nr:glycosyltransferase family 2 protein [Steroidobacteraceae bacterium]